MLNVEILFQNLVDKYRKDMTEIMLGFMLLLIMFF